MTGKKWLAAAAVVVTSLLLALTIVEVVLRVKERNSDNSQRAIRTRDSYLHHNLKPMAEGRLLWLGGRINRYATNNLAYRDRTTRVVAKRTAAAKRILVLGDSFAEGFGVEYQDTFVARFEGSLQRAGRSVEILDGGVVSYSPFLELRKLQAFLDAGYTTDEVVLFFDISDVQDEGHDDEYASLKGEERFRYSLKERVQDLEIYRLLQARFAGPDPESDLIFRERGRWTEEPGIFERWGKRGLERCLRSLEKMAELLRARGIRFHLVIYPWPTQLESKNVPSLEETLLGRFAAEHGIDLINLYPAFRAVTPWRDDFIAEDCHWNEKGHELVANELLRAAAW